MTRLHVHLKVDDLDQSVGFYSALFGRAPDRRETDYAKWMLDDPRANIAISASGAAPGVDHVGLQVEEREELDVIAARLKEAGHRPLSELNATCCYAKSNKHWAMSPDGAARWELFHTFADADRLGSAPVITKAEAQSQPEVCCV
jgi:catechol 2,3-dioxygenase-like lactoylglutathione lyase family enzyme